MFQRDQIGVLSDPAQSGPRSPGFVHHRLNVNADFACRFPVSLFDPRKQRTQLVADDLVIVIAPGIAGTHPRPHILSMPRPSIPVEPATPDPPPPGNESR